MTYKYLQALLSSFFLSLLLLLCAPQGAFAAISQIQEAPGQVVIKSRHILRDESGNSWQTVLYKRVKDELIESINLRLVGFPGTVKFSHPQPLKIVTVDGIPFLAPDLFAAKSPAPEIGEYDVAEILPKLPRKWPVRLFFPLVNSEVKMQVPYPVVLQWLDIAESAL